MWLLRWNISLRKKRFLKIIDRGPYLVGFPAMQIMNLWGMFFHPANVSSLTFSLWVKSCSALCDVEIEILGIRPKKHFIWFHKIHNLDVGLHSVAKQRVKHILWKSLACVLTLLLQNLHYFEIWRIGIYHIF